jgi:hypothetical protein
MPFYHYCLDFRGKPRIPPQASLAHRSPLALPLQRLNSHAERPFCVPGTLANCAMRRKRCVDVGRALARGQVAPGLPVTSLASARC